MSKSPKLTETQKGYKEKHLQTLTLLSNLIWFETLSGIHLVCI